MKHTQFGIQIQFDSAGIVSVSDKHQVDYNVKFNSEELPKSISVDFFSVNKFGFGLMAQNAICHN